MPSSSALGFISRTLDQLAALPFDHDGQQSLPMREDVFHFARACLLEWQSGHPCGSANGLLPPVMQLRTDGTLDVTFLGGMASFALWFPCRGVMAWEKCHPDQVTTESDVVGAASNPASYITARNKIRELAAWLSSLEET